MTIAGWQQIEAGLELIKWSKLARWDDSSHSLVAAIETEFKAYAGKPPNRVISWLVFSVGCEYLLKGVCIIKGYISSHSKKLPQPPFGASEISDFRSWAAKVMKNDASVMLPEDIYPELGTLPYDKLLNGLADEQLFHASFKLLAATIRNRDAHSFVQGVRDAQFFVVPALLVPALNAVLDTLDLEERHKHGMG